MNYNLGQFDTKKEKKKPTLKKVRELLRHTVNNKRKLGWAFVAMVFNSILSLAGPLIIGHTIDQHVTTKEYDQVLIFSAILLGIYVVAFATRYLQTILMGTVGQHVLFNLRNSLFEKLQELPVDFFNQNKAGDLISRLNNDTDKLNQFFSQSLMQFVSNLFIMIGSGIFLLSINLKLGAAALAPALFLFIYNKMVDPWVKQKNQKSLESVGNLSSEVQESLDNFKVIVAFNRRDYFRQRFGKVNDENYSRAIGAGIANNLFFPVYGFAANIGQLIVLIYGISLILQGMFTIGLLISFLSYVTSFYYPLRQLAALWANFQVALAGWNRISQILSLQSDLFKLKTDGAISNSSLLAFQNVSFSYHNGTDVLSDIDFNLQAGKTYALVGPTGGGKTTTASLMARLYDPVKGKVLLHGKDIRCYSPEERTQMIGFILQEPILFSGTVRDNILYGNHKLWGMTNEQLTEALKEAGLTQLINRFEAGLDTQVDASGGGISLGQKQIIAFMRAVLRQPALLILDEATANIDTITEKQLDDILEKLPPETTRVIIAHRLNTIENADEIFFVNANKVTHAGSLEHAVDMLMKGKGGR
jgi:ATP-binding cassette, subfamily B, bacterial